MKFDTLKYFGYSIVELNVDNIYVYTKKSKTESRIIIIFDGYDEENFTKMQCENAIEQILENCENNGFDNIKLMKVFYCDKISYAKKVCEDALIISLDDNKFYKESNFLDWEEELVCIKTDSANIAKEYGIHILNKKSTKEEVIEVLKKATTWIVLVNIIIFFVGEIIYYFFGEEQYISMLQAGCISWAGAVDNRQFYRVLTSIFLHSNIQHLSGNMISLLAIGIFLEKAVGKRKLILVYLLTGVIADLVSISYNMVEQNKYSASIGASGAIFGLVGVVLALFIVNRKIFGRTAMGRFVIYVILMLNMGFNSVGVDNAAHVGGFVAGIIIGIVMFYLVPEIKKSNKYE